MQAQTGAEVGKHSNTVVGQKATLATTNRFASNQEASAVEVTQRWLLPLLDNRQQAGSAGRMQDNNAGLARLSGTSTQLTTTLEQHACSRKALKAN